MKKVGNEGPNTHTTKTMCNIFEISKAKNMVGQSISVAVTEMLVMWLRSSSKIT